MLYLNFVAIIKSRLKELVAVLILHHIYLVDYPPVCNIQSYFEQVYDRCSSRLRPKILSKSIEELDFSIRTWNCLKRAGIDSVGDLVNKSEEDMIRGVRNLGSKSLSEIKEKLASLGLSLLDSESGL